MTKKICPSTLYRTDIGKEVTVFWIRGHAMPVGADRMMTEAEINETLAYAENRRAWCSNDAENVTMALGMVLWHE